MVGCTCWPKGNQKDVGEEEATNGPAGHGQEPLRTEGNALGQLSPMQGASPRLSPRGGMNRRDEQRHGSLRARLGIDALHATFLRNSKLSPVRRRRMTAEQVSGTKEQKRTPPIASKVHATNGNVLDCESKTMPL